jgi:hypothetical protein
MHTANQTHCLANLIAILVALKQAGKKAIK